MQHATRRLAVSAVMLALAAMLSLVIIFEMPSGGSVTLFSMLPICLIAYIYGVKWGLLVGLVHGVIQALLGHITPAALSNNIGLFILMWLLDYLFAFASLGLAGVFRKIFKNTYIAFSIGVVAACFIRFILHTISGSLIWELAWIPSMAYNASYMVPECMITIIGTNALTPILPRLLKIIGSTDLTEA